MKATSRREGRTIHLRGSEGDDLPAALGVALEGVDVARAWLRAVGVVADVVLRSLDGDGNAIEVRVGGPAQLVSLEGVVEAEGEASLAAVIASEAPNGAITHVGTLVFARALAFDAMAVELGESAAPAEERTPVAAPPAERRSSPALEVEWGDAATPKHRAKPAAPTFEAAPIPGRLKTATAEFVEEPTPEAGDMVDHFAFGTCEVVQSDGERIHLRLDKDQRIKEIALAMLKVVPVDLSSRPRIFRLVRRV